IFSFSALLGLAGGEGGHPVVVRRNPDESVRKTRRGIDRADVGFAMENRFGLLLLIFLDSMGAAS
ncbi:MAG: hypothetical protein ACKOAU_17550, partial [Pirellula sp.]